MSLTSRQPDHRVLHNTYPVAWPRRHLGKGEGGGGGGGGRRGEGEKGRRGEGGGERGK